jgi:Peptidase family M28
MPDTANRGLILALAGIALLLVATLIAYQPAAPLGPDTAPTVFSAYRAKAILQDLVGNGVPHPLGSPANARLRDVIVQRLTALGYSAELQTGFVCNDEGECGSPVNIVARLAGGHAENEGDVVLLAAHYDSVPAGPGASDDGAGVATVLEIARILAARPAPTHPIALLLTDGEEAGLLGAVLFVRDHPLSKRVAAAVNLDARGTSGPSLMFETGAANAWLMRLYRSAIARPMTNSLYYVVYKQLQNDTDFTVFKTAAYQGFNFAFIGNVGRYHTPLDKVANAGASSIQNQGDNALAALTALADSTTLRAPNSEAVFFDVFAHALIAWPIAFTLPAALLALAVVLIETILLLRRKALAGREILWGWVGILFTLALGVALCAAVLALLTRVGKVPPISGESWIARPLGMHVAAAAMAFLAAGIAGAWLARRAGFWGFWTAATLFLALLSVACAVFAPGASFVLLLAAMAAALGAMPSMVGLARSRGLSRWATEFAALFPLLVLFAAALPQLRFLYLALGSLAWPVSTLVLSLGAATLLPLLAAANGRARRIVIAAAGLAAVAGTLLTLSFPTYSADWPERINLEYWLDADTGQSHYLARCDGGRLPAALAAAAQFDPVPRPRIAGGTSLAFYAVAPRLALASPELTLTSPPVAATERTIPSTHFELRLTSPRGAPEAFIVFPASAHVANVVLKTSKGPVNAKLRRLGSGATLLDVVDLPAAGLEFSLDAAGSLPVGIQIMDQNFDFPADGAALRNSRPPDATSSQDGDVTVVHRTVSLEPV